MALFACFNADGPYWDNTVRTIAYPSGVSYFRPFRYRDTWIAADVLPALTDPERHSELVGRTAHLSMSFGGDGYQRLFVPFREIEITHINPAPDTNAIFFKLGPFLNLDAAESLREEAREKPAAIPANCLFFDADIDVKPKRVEQDEEDEAWLHFIELVRSSADHLPIKEAALRSQYIRVRRPTISNEPATPEVLYTSTNGGPSHGYALNEGTRSEFAYLHRLPALIGTELAAGRYHIQHVSESGNVEVDRTQDEITGRYQPHFFTVTAKRPSGTFEELVLASDVDEITAENDTKLVPLDVPIPFRVKWHWQYRAKTRLVPLLILFAAIALTNLGSYYFERQDNPSLPELSGTATLVRVATSAILAFVIWFFQQRPPRD